MRQAMRSGANEARGGRGSPPFVNSDERPDSDSAAARQDDLRVEDLHLKFEVFETGGVDLAREAARNSRTLRKRGHTVRKTIDVLIATFCLREGHSLLHRDRDFDSFEEFLELWVVHP